MKWISLVIVIVLCAGCVDQADQGGEPTPPYKTFSPPIASWLSKKDELLASEKPFSLIMTSWVTPEEAQKFKKINPHITILAGLTVNWVYDKTEWIQFLETIASADNTQRTLKDSMFLKRPDGKKCAFGWASPEWGHQEIYAMDPRDPEWVNLVLAAYRITLEQPHHDGVIVDMVMDRSWCPDAITDEEWVSATRDILKEIRRMADLQNKTVFFNAGRDFQDIDLYAEYMDGYVMENFLGEWGAGYDAGLQAADSSYTIVYAVDTDDTGIKDLKRMRLGLTLSLLNDNTYFAYDFGPRDHGQAWWFPEYNAELGIPLGEYYKRTNAYWREFERGIVVSSPYTDVTITLNEPHTDLTTGKTSTIFEIGKGDGRILLRLEESENDLFCRIILLLKLITFF